MAMEMVCGQCQGRFLAEVPGSVVMCPHCGAHLQTPEAEAWPPGTLAETLTVPAAEKAIPISPDATLVAPPPAPAPVIEETLVAEARPAPEFLPPDAPSPVEETLLQVGPPPALAGSNAESELTGLTESWTPAEPPAKSFAAWETSVPGGNDLFPDFSTVAHEAPPTKEFSPESHPMLQRPAGMPDQQPFPSTVAFSPESHPMLRRPPTPEPTYVEMVAPTKVLPGAAADVTMPMINTSPAPAAAPKAAPVEGGVSPATFRMVVSYASAVTLACLYLLWQVLAGGNVNPQLESLPDLEPPEGRGGKEVTLWSISSDAPMNPGHTLKLGESQRFGSLRVTPLKVVREPIEFVHFDPSVKFERMKTAPVLKLYLKFENVSNDPVQPLSDKLVYVREPHKRKRDVYVANNFVCRAEDKGDAGKLVLMYHRSPSDSFDVKGQKLNTEISPGETFETFLASSDEGLEVLEGDLLWRVHFRKGYNPGSGRGVTTLIEVAFHSDEIEDAPAPADPTPPAEPQKPAPSPSAAKS
jgi:hypothetical protein